MHQSRWNNKMKCMFIYSNLGTKQNMIKLSSTFDTMLSQEQPLSRKAPWVMTSFCDPNKNVLCCWLAGSFHKFPKSKMQVLFFILLIFFNFFFYFLVFLKLLCIPRQSLVTVLIDKHRVCICLRCSCQWSKCQPRGRRACCPYSFA